MMTDILFCTWNRLGFTKFAWRQLLANTNWDQVNKLVVHDDGSSDGTADWIRTQVKRHSPVEAVFHQASPPRESVPAVMNWYVAQSEAEWFAKIDNDIIVPPGWLPKMTGVLERNPTVEMLGMEAGRGLPETPEWDGVYRFEPGSHTGGVGVFLVDAFRRRVRMAENRGRYGFTEFQHEYQPVRGWINPDIAVVSLDRVPFEPWLSLSQTYIEKEWQREWGCYHERADYWDWWPPEAFA